MSVRTRMFSALLVLTLTGGAAATATPAHAVTSRGVTIPAFYTPPSVLPSASGALIRTEALPLALSLPGITGTLPGRATRQEGVVHLVLLAAFLFLAVNP